MIVLPKTLGYVAFISVAAAWATGATLMALHKQNQTQDRQVLRRQVLRRQPGREGPAPEAWRPQLCSAPFDTPGLGEMARDRSGTTGITVAQHLHHLRHKS